MTVGWRLVRSTFSSESAGNTSDGGNFEGTVRVRDACVVFLVWRTVLSGLCRRRPVATSWFAILHSRMGLGMIGFGGGSSEFE